MERDHVVYSKGYDGVDECVGDEVGAECYYTGECYYAGEIALCRRVGVGME